MVRRTYCYSSCSDQGDNAHTMPATVVAMRVRVVDRVGNGRTASDPIAEHRLPRFDENSYQNLPMETLDETQEPIFSDCACPGRHWHRSRSEQHRRHR